MVVGAIGGALSSIVMLGLLEVLAPGSRATSRYLTELGAAIFNLQLSSVFIVHVVMGTSFGALYASSQRPVPVPGMISVGIFFGFFLWVVGALLAGMFLGTGLQSVLRTWLWLSGCVSYGLVLALVALLWQKIQPERARALLRD